MNNNIKYLMMLSKIISLELFYAINIWSDYIGLQGTSSPELIYILMKYKFKQTGFNNDLLEYQRKNIRITVTK